MASPESPLTALFPESPPRPEVVNNENNDRKWVSLEELRQKHLPWSRKEEKLKARGSKALGGELFDILNEIDQHKMSEPKLDLPKSDDESGEDDGAESGEDDGAESGQHDGDEFRMSRRAAEHLLGLGAESGAEPKPVQKRKRDAETEEEMPQKRIAQRLAPRPLAPPEGCIDAVHGEIPGLNADQAWVAEALHGWGKGCDHRGGGDATAGKDSGRSVVSKSRGMQKVKAIIELMNMMIAELREGGDPDEVPAMTDMLKAWQRYLANKMFAVPPTDV